MGYMDNSEMEPLIGGWGAGISLRICGQSAQSTQQDTGVPALGQGCVQPEGRVDVAPGRF